ncbi:MAG: sigma-54-dependent Fis family transcriptional regulator [Deltaproteobacteria bacterium]|nr:sigma-54-dependent Fis family transcriptional regulator [Deltaproteobacteria bacterium]
MGPVFQSFSQWRKAVKESRKTGPVRVAVVDDEPVAAREIRRGMEKDHCLVETFGDGESFLLRCRETSFDLVICDLRLPGIDGLAVLREIKTFRPATEVIIVTAYSTVDTAVEAIKSGAFHYVTKPLRMAELRALASRALERAQLVREKEALKSALFTHRHGRRLVGSSRLMQEVRGLIRKVSSLNCNVLIQGESGTGKEIVARALHLEGTRKDHPFISFNCGGFTEDLIANELFGHEKGAFTGAMETKIGLLEAAHKGTIFLDEIGAMPPSMQVKLLRFVQERTLLRVGGIKPIPVDVRLVAASNQDLRKAVENGKFREDLYYRLKVVVIPLPPLRQRKEDIPLLIRHFLKKYCRLFGKEVRGLDPEALQVLQHYPFPGNVRELENIVERAVALADSDTIGTRDLPSDLQRLSISSLEEQEWPSLEDREREYIRRVLIKTGYRKQEAAKILKVPRTTLWRKMKRLGLE